MKMYDRPLAAEGLQSYRYKGRYGYVMIGAMGDADAMDEAKRSCSCSVSIVNLEKWDGKNYVRV